MFRECQCFHRGTKVDMLDPVDTPVPPIHTGRSMSQDPMLEVTELSVHYGERVAAENVSLNVARGEILALIGPNGAGKSTLIKAISGVLPIHQGRVLINGQDAMQLSPVQRARHVAVIPQAVALPPAFTAWQTVLMGRTPYLGFLGQPSPWDIEITWRALERVDALQFSERRVGEISGGEAQRVLLARALAQSAPLLLLDEPIAHLDLKYQLNILTLVSDLAHKDGFSVLIVLHDLNLASQYADRVALIANGEMMAVGSPEEILTAELLSPAYGVPLQVMPHPVHGRPFVFAPGTMTPEN